VHETTECDRWEQKCHGSAKSGCNDPGAALAVIGSDVFVGYGLLDCDLEEYHEKLNLPLSLASFGFHCLHLISGLSQSLDRRGPMTSWGPPDISATIEGIMRGQGVQGMNAPRMTSIRQVRLNLAVHAGF
jgi:hypothetical protein